MMGSFVQLKVINLIINGYDINKNLSFKTGKYILKFLSYKQVNILFVFSGI